MLTEIDRLLAVRAIGLPSDLFGDVAPKVVFGWRARAAVEWPSHLRDHPEPLRLMLLAALHPQTIHSMLPPLTVALARR